MNNREDSSKYVVYVDHTSSSSDIGYSTGSEDPLSIMTLIRNATIIMESNPVDAKPDEIQEPV